MPDRVVDLVAALDRRAPFAKAAEWDPVGLQVGDPEAPCRPVVVVHEVTEAVVRHLEAQPVGTVVAYHPLLFGSVTALRAGSSPAGRAYRLARLDTALVVVHTAFDVAAGGTADALADAFALEGVEGFGPAWPTGGVKVVTFVPVAAADAVAAAMAAAGGGRIGNYTDCTFRLVGTGTFSAGPGATPVVGEPGRANAVEETRVEMTVPGARRDAVVAALVAAHPYEEPAFDVYEATGNAGMIGRAGSLPAPLPLVRFAATVEERLGSAVRVAGPLDRPVERVAVVPGSGGTFLGAAAELADVLVTGDVSHHRVRAALDRGLAVIDAGHVPTERPGLRSLYAAVLETTPDAVDLTAIDAHPWEEPTWRS